MDNYFKNKINKINHIVIAAGGTGGHIYPGLAVAQELIQRGYSVSWMGSYSGLEKKIIGENLNNLNLELDLLNIAGVRKKGILSWFVLPFKLSRAVWQAYKILKKRRANLVISFGGFASGPAGIAIKLLNKKLFIHEQNAVLGFTNFYLAKFADQIFTAFPIEKFLSLKNYYLIGNPVRPEILNLRNIKNIRDIKNFKILITGGSQGSEVFNTLIPEALSKISSSISISIHHQAGPKSIGIAEKKYQEKKLAGMSHEVYLTPYFLNIAEEYAWADLVICRAGALTVYELAIAGVPAIFIPHPGVVDDHQRKNAEWLSSRNINLCLVQKDLSPEKLGAEKLAQEIQKLINTPEILKRWREAAYLETDNKKEAVRLLVDHVDQLN